MSAEVKEVLPANAFFWHLFSVQYNDPVCHVVCPLRISALLQTVSL